MCERTAVKPGAHNADVAPISQMPAPRRNASGALLEPTQQLLEPRVLGGSERDT